MIEVRIPRGTGLVFCFQNENGLGLFMSNLERFFSRGVDGGAIMRVFDSVCQLRDERFCITERFPVYAGKAWNSGYEFGARIDSPNDEEAAVTVFFAGEGVDRVYFCCVGFVGQRYIQYWTDPNGGDDFQQSLLGLCTEACYVLPNDQGFANFAEYLFDKHGPRHDPRVFQNILFTCLGWSSDAWRPSWVEEKTLSHYAQFKCRFNDGWFYRLAGYADIYGKGACSLLKRLSEEMPVTAIQDLQ